MQLAYLAEQYLLKDELKLGPAAVAAVFATAHVPWVIKPLYGFLSDSLPLPFPGAPTRERRRPYLVLCGLAGTAAYAGLATAPPSRHAVVALMATGELSIAFSDVVVDGVVVALARGEPQAISGALQSLAWGAQAAGSLASAWAAGALVQAAGPRPVLALMALFPLLIGVAALFVDERRLAAGKASRSRSDDGSSGVGVGGSSPPPSIVDGDLEDGAAPDAVHLGGELAARGGQASTQHSPTRRAAARAAAAAAPSLATQVRSLASALTTPATLAPALFIFAYHASPHAGSALFYFYTNELNFKPEFLGRVNLIDGVASLAGVAAFNARLKHLPLARVLAGITVAAAAASATQLLLVTRANRALGVPDAAFLVFDSALLAALGRIALMPVLVLAARLCPDGVEASLFAALMSIQRRQRRGRRDRRGRHRRVWGDGHRVWGVPALVGVCAVGRLLPLLLLPLVRNAVG